MYENRLNEGNYLEPTQLVDSVARLIDEFDFKEAEMKHSQQSIFKKSTVPKKQVMALYAINKISSLANK